MTNITIISGHPNHSNSISSNQIINYLEQSNISDYLLVRKLEDLHSNFDFNIEEEQSFLLKSDIVILQFPLFWYSFPALMKKWIDDVICHDFAFGGEKGAQLKDKKFIFSFTMGGKETAYNNSNEIELSIEELIKPLKQIFKFCSITDIEYVFSNNMLYIPNVYGVIDDIKYRSRLHADKILSIIK